MENLIQTAFSPPEIIWDGYSRVDIETYGRVKEGWLRQFLALPNGLPSHDTTARLFAALNPEALQTCFLRWIRSVAQLSAGIAAATVCESVVKPKH